MADMAERELVTVGGARSTRWGRRREPPRALVDEVPRLDARQAARSLLTGRRAGVGPIEWTPTLYRTRSGRLLRRGTLTTLPSLGRVGLRPAYAVHLVRCDMPHRDRFDWWLVCPGCRTRRRALFLCSPGLRCRACGRLAYRSEGLTRRKRAEWQRLQLARRINPYWDSTSRPPERPPNVHRERYARLLAAWEAEHERARGTPSHAAVHSRDVRLLNRYLRRKSEERKEGETATEMAPGRRFRDTSPASR